MTAVTDENPGQGRGGADEAASPREAAGSGGWDDGLIARRAQAARAEAERTPDEIPPEDDGPPPVEAYVDTDSGSPLRPRLDALRELVGLSRARLDRAALAEAGRVLDEAAARQRLSSRHTVVAIAGASGSGKSALFNALAGAQLSETGLRRPTTSSPSPAPGPTGPPGCSTGWPCPAGSGAGRSPGRRPTRRSRAWSSSTCPTTTRPRVATATRSTGSWRWSTP